MRPFASSISLRLMVWFLVLSILPLAVVVIFVRQNVAESFKQTVGLAQEGVALANANFLDVPSHDLNRVADFLSQAQPESGTHFLATTEGEILWHLNPALIGTTLESLYGVPVAAAALGNDSGWVLDESRAQLVSFARLRSKPWVDVVVIDSAVAYQELDRVMIESSIQLLISLLVVAAAGSTVSWLMIGKPLRRLTQVAESLGQGNLSVSADPEEMDYELGTLAVTFNKTRDQIRDLVAGLEARVRELDQATSSLTASEERFRTIFDSMNDTIVVQDIKTGNFLDVNQKFIELFGYSRDEALKMTLGDLSSNEGTFNQRTVLRLTRRTLEVGSQAVEWRARDKHGRVFWVEINMRKAMLNDQPHLILAIRDIDQRKKNEQMQIAVYRITQVSKSSPTLYEFFATVHEIIRELLPASSFVVATQREDQPGITFAYYLDEQGTSSPGASQFYDQTLLESVLKTGEVLLVTPNLFEELGEELGWEHAPDFHNWLGSPMQSGRRVLGALAIKTYSPVVLNASDKETIGFLANQVAISMERKLSEEALRESEARWRTLMENAPQLIVTFDRFGEILYINHTLREWDVVVEGRTTITDLFPGDDDAIKRDMLQRIFSDRLALSFELSLPNRQGDPVWLSCNVAPVVDLGRVDIAIFNAVEITSRKLAEEQILRLNEQLELRVLERTAELESVNKELEAFSYSISHDLRAPLRAIDGFARMLGQELPENISPNGRRYLTVVRENALQMGVLIDDLLSFSRLSRQPLRKQLVNVRDLIEQAMNTLFQEIDGRDIEWLIADLPPCHGDSALLKQVWINLISNAIKFTRHCSPAKIEIGFERQPSKNIRYFIRDNGTGFDMQYAHKLFGVFQRLHRPEEFEGTGVGLAIVHRIIRRHGGQIWAESEQNRGATFHILLPEND